MPVYANSAQLYGSLSLLFDQIKEKDPGALRSLQASRLLIRLRCTLPGAEVLINGRQSPVQIRYGVSGERADLDVTLPADTLHLVLLAELPLRKAIASGQMRVRGPIFKTFALEEILHHGQALYPQVLREQGLNGHGA